MKIVIAGGGLSPLYEVAFAKALRNLGHEVMIFATSNYINGLSGNLSLLLPFSNLTLFRLNQDLLHTIKEHKPDLFMSWRATYLFPSTIQAINSLGVLTVSYNNDDPFKRKVFVNARWHQYFEWFWYLRGLRFYQRNFLTRTQVRKGSASLSLLPQESPSTESMLPAA